MKNNWPVKKLAEIAENISGTWGVADAAGTAVLRSTNFNNDGTISWDDVAYRSISNNKINQLALSNGDILLEKSGGSPAQPVGRVVYFEDQKQGKIVFGNFISKLKVKDSIVEPKFLFYYLLYFYRNGEINRYQSQTTGIRNLQLKDYLGIEIPSFRIATQKKIVEKLDALRKGQELIDLQIQKNQELFESLLSEIFNSYQEQLKPLGEICTFLGGGTPSKKNDSYYKGLIPWITIKDMRGNEIYDSIDHVTADAIKESAANFVSKNTLLVATRVGLGKIAITRVDACFNQDIKALIPKAEIILEYLLFSMIHVSPQIVSHGVGGTVKGVNLTMLKKLQIPFPSISEQKEIVGKLKAIQEYKKLLLKQKQLYKELFDSILYKSMKGEI